MGWGLGTEGSSQLRITVFGWRLPQYDKSVDSKQNFRSSPTHPPYPRVRIVREDVDRDPGKSQAHRLVLSSLVWFLTQSFTR